LSHEDRNDDDDGGDDDASTFKLFDPLGPDGAAEHTAESGS